MRRVIAVILLMVAMFASSWRAEARPGGGDTYSSGRDSDTRSGSGRAFGGDRYDDADRADFDAFGQLVIVFVRILIRYPIIGILALAVFFSYAGVLAWAEKRDRAAWDSAHPASVASAVVDTPQVLDDIKTLDPDFSPILFEDFVFRLYATAHGVRADAKKLDELAPYLSPSVRRALAARQPVGEAVSNVVVGAMRVYRVNVPTAIDDSNRNTAVVTVSVEFEANYSTAGGRHFVVETWALRRAVGARTRRPDASRRFACPSCGAPWRTADAAKTQKCQSCGEIVDNGRFDWQVVDVRVRSTRDHVATLTQEVEERGTDLPTVRDGAVDQQWSALLTHDAALTEAALIARLHFIYGELNRAWSNGDIGPARAVLSDGIADYLQYWLDAYATAKLRNVLEDMRITRHELARVRRDRSYDAVTIRLWATGKDYVVSTDNGAGVRGSRTNERAYSEYWTLIRSATRTGTPSADRRCGSCGATLTVSMAGACEHCGAHVTAGEFDWVLSQIEQDDSYRG